MYDNMMRKVNGPFLIKLGFLLNAISDAWWGRKIGNKYRFKDELIRRWLCSNFDLALFPRKIIYRKKRKARNYLVRNELRAWKRNSESRTKVFCPSIEMKSKSCSSLFSVLSSRHLSSLELIDCLVHTLISSHEVTSRHAIFRKGLLNGSMFIRTPWNHLILCPFPSNCIIKDLYFRPCGILNLTVSSPMNTEEKILEALFLSLKMSIALEESIAVHESKTGRHFEGAHLLTYCIRWMRCKKVCNLNNIKTVVNKANYHRQTEKSFWGGSRKMDGV